MQMAAFIFEHKSEMPVIKAIPQLVSHPKSQAMWLSTTAFLRVSTESSLLATLWDLGGCFTAMHTVLVTFSLSSTCHTAVVLLSYSW